MLCWFDLNIEIKNLLCAINKLQLMRISMEGHKVSQKFLNN